MEEPNIEDGYCSYMVFRKLEQNVKKFRKSAGDLANLLNIDADGAAALAVGRHRDATPAIPTLNLDPTADPNDFNFEDDRPTPPAAGSEMPISRSYSKDKSAWRRPALQQ